MEKENRSNKRYRGGRRRPESLDEKVKEAISSVLEQLQDTFAPATVRGLNPFQRRQIHLHFEKTQEYKVRAQRGDGDEVVLQIYPVGQLRRMAETKVQEVLMTGESIALPPMGSYERFIVHEYIKERGGVRTESFGEGVERHIVVFPVFGRVPKKAKRRLTR